jgi:hypothetical protein
MRRLSQHGTAASDGRLGTVLMWEIAPALYVAFDSYV